MQYNWCSKLRVLSSKLRWTEAQIYILSSYILKRYHLWHGNCSSKPCYRYSLESKEKKYWFLLKFVKWESCVIKRLSNSNNDHQCWCMGAFHIHYVHHLYQGMPLPSHAKHSLWSVICSAVFERSISTRCQGIACRNILTRSDTQWVSDPPLAQSEFPASLMKADRCGTARTIITPMP